MKPVLVHHMFGADAGGVVYDVLLKRSPIRSADDPAEMFAHPAGHT